MSYVTGPEAPAGLAGAAAVDCRDEAGADQPPIRSSVPFTSTITLANVVVPTLRTM
jgi:hypothetical protein